MSAQQSLLSIVQAVELATGHRPNIESVRRWYKRGVAGVRLEVQYFQGKYLTTVEAVQRFIEKSTEAKMARYENPVILKVEDIAPVCNEKVEAAVAQFNAMSPTKRKSSTKRLKPARNRKV